MSNHDDLDEIAAALAATHPGDTPTILVGWISVAEYSDLDGRRYLAVRSGTAPDTDHLTTSWQRRGYLDEALSSNWDDPAYDLHDDPADDE